MDYLNEMDEILKKYLMEAGLDYSHNKLGETKFTTTTGSEPYIQDIIKQYATAAKITVPAAEKIFKDASDKAISKMVKSPKMNGTMMQNIAESIAFDMLKAIPMEDIKFEKRVFQEIFQEVKSEVPEFYPLTNGFEPKRIEASIYYSPDKLYPEFNSIDTAACTPDAKLIFNVPFMRELVKFATLKGVKASSLHLHGKKYESQGGDIPDAYVYCEFVLLHEIMHYGNGDFYFEKAFNLNGNIVNYVGDFITNYNLVKSGYAQLPIGLFNDEINYDRYNSYQQMYNVVEDELNKLSPEDQKNMMDQLDDMGDNMPQNGEGSTPNNKPKDGQKQKGQGKPGEPSDENSEPQDGDGSGKGKPGDDQQSQDGAGSGSDGDKKQSDEEKDGSGDSGKESDDKKTDKKGSSGDSAEDKAEQKRKEEEAKADMKAQSERAKEQAENEKAGKTSGTAPSDLSKPKGEVPKSLDDIMKGKADALGNAQSDRTRETQTGMNPDAMKPGDIAAMMSGENTGTGKNSADGNPYNLGERQYKPKMNWKAMLKKMVPSGVIENETYSKPSRRTTSSMVTVAQTGAGVVKPGVKEEDSEKRGLCFVLDNSGSTMDKIGAMQNDIMMLMQKEAKKINGIMYVMKFSNDAHYFKIDIKKKKYARITDVAEFVATGKSSVKPDKPVAELFKSSYGGGTELTAKITMAVKTLFTQKFNVVLFSDSDIVGGNNSTQLKQIYNAGKKQLALIGCDKNDYKNYVNLLGDKGNITYYA